MIVTPKLTLADRSFWSVNVKSVYSHCIHNWGILCVHLCIICGHFRYSVALDVDPSRPLGISVALAALMLAFTDFPLPMT